MIGCKPIDLAHLREKCRGNITPKKMGMIIPQLVPSCVYRAVPQSRVRVWERGRRSVPEYVYFAYVGYAANVWACKRREAKNETELMNTDFEYGSLLNPAFGEFLKLEHIVRQSSDPALQGILPSLILQREHWKQYFIMLCGRDLEYVWTDTENMSS